MTRAEEPVRNGAVSVQSTVGTAFPYQGELEISGSLPTGTADFQFSLFDASTGGIQIGSTQTKLGVSVDDGVFTVQLDFGSSAFVGDARWLEVAVRVPAGSGSYITLSPRQSLNAVPYALYARTIPLSGSGSAATAARSDHDHGTDGWIVGGNSGLTPSTNKLGSTNNVSVTLIVNNAAALRLEPNSTSPNIIGGYAGNSVPVGVVAATIAGGGASGKPNTVSASYGTIGGGSDNSSSGIASTIGGGSENSASNSYAALGGGYQNVASGWSSTLGGGAMNWVHGSYATIGGGFNIQADGAYGTVGGGNFNSAFGNYSTVPGGYYNYAGGVNSFAAGRQAIASHDGAFVWGDYTNADVKSSGANQFIVRANGGIWFGRGTTEKIVTIASGDFISTSTGAKLTMGGTWTNASDRNAKENFVATNGREVLDRLLRIPISTWNYKAEDPTVRHLGPTAQDFRAAFGLGDGNTHIGTVDADGVALAAIQGLSQVVAEKDARIEQMADRTALQQDEIIALQRQNAIQQEAIEALLQRLEALEAKVAR